MRSCFILAFAPFGTASFGAYASLELGDSLDLETDIVSFQRNSWTQGARVAPGDIVDVTFVIKTGSAERQLLEKKVCSYTNQLFLIKFV